MFPIKNKNAIAEKSTTSESTAGGDLIGYDDSGRGQGEHKENEPEQNALNGQAGMQQTQGQEQPMLSTALNSQAAVLGKSNNISRGDSSALSQPSRADFSQSIRRKIVYRIERGKEHIFFLSLKVRYFFSRRFVGLCGSNLGKSGQKLFKPRYSELRFWAIWKNNETTRHTK